MICQSIIPEDREQLKLATDSPPPVPFELYDFSKPGLAASRAAYGRYYFPFDQNVVTSLF